MKKKIIYFFYLQVTLGPSMNHGCLKIRKKINFYIYLQEIFIDLCFKIIKINTQLKLNNF
jgi:hypothetical protein